MSGGYFGYTQNNMTQIIEEIQYVIDHNNEELPKEAQNEYDKYYFQFSDEVIDKLKEAIASLQLARIYTQRVDWLLSGDDGEEEFLERLDKELNG